MHKCIICKKEKGTKGLSFHRFPKDVQLVHLWLQNIEKENYVPTSNSFICSTHFAPECLEQKYNYVRLKRGVQDNVHNTIQNNVHNPVQNNVHNSVYITVSRSLSDENLSMEYEPDDKPSVDPLAEPHSSDVESSEMHVLPTDATCNKSTITTDPYNYVESRQLVCHDHQYTYTPTSYRRQLNNMRKSLSEARNAKRVLNQKVKRLQTTVSSLKQMVCNLKKLILVTQEASRTSSTLKD
ncbi:THAP domain-containing protein 1-like isoform X2 [Calliopsis andreniformis]|uniref:THAP domain-containing protein 1-like isoform X2 n=1 Tax=Calliopsis andreniformis TaxID=337506 RepID=UPI003FCC9531